MDTEPRVFRDGRAILVESIFWDERTDELCWVDITAGTFHRGRLDGAVDGSDDRVVSLPPPVSAVQPASDGGFVAALKDRIVLLDPDGMLSDEVARVTHAHAGLRFNEGKVDPFGRFVVGSMNLTTGAPDAAVYLVDTDGSIVLLRGGFGVANGMEWSDDKATMFLTDTSTRTVYRAAYSDTKDPLGELEPHLVGHPSDGLALDTRGEFFNGLYGDGAVLRWSASGEETLHIPLPAPHVTSVAFGGPDLDTLFVGTARENLGERDLAEAPLSGAIFALDLGTRGRPVHTFAPSFPLERI